MSSKHENLRTHRWRQRDVLAKHAGAVVLISSNSAHMATDANYIDSLLAGDETRARDHTAKMTGQPAYTGSKQALTRWMRRNNGRYAGQGIRMNAIGPGYTQTANSPSRLTASD
jgi:NAD(P)-dependent dehydrogenase (short-subunit alcohol dehydrogenase family)